MKKILAALIVPISMVLALTIVPTQQANACFLGIGDDCGSSDSNSSGSSSNGGCFLGLFGDGCGQTDNGESKCGDTKTGIIACEDDSGIGAIGDLIKYTTIILSTLVGIAGIGGIAYGAVLYATAQDNQSQVDSAKVIIRNVVIGLVLYAFTLVIVNWLLPTSAIESPPPADDGTSQTDQSGNSVPVDTGADQTQPTTP